jgi:hypothetical protein
MMAAFLTRFTQKLVGKLKLPVYFCKITGGKRAGFTLALSYFRLYFEYESVKALFYGSPVFST